MFSYLLNWGVMDNTVKMFGYNDLWKEKLAVSIAKKNPDLILGSIKSLPLEYWRKNFFFKGAPNKSIGEWTRGLFADKAAPDGTHPVFALKPILSYSGFKVCPCSSSAQRKHSRWIAKGTKLLHTNICMDKKSFLVESLPFNIPSLEAGKLRFLGEVPENAIRSGREKGYTNE